MAVKQGRSLPKMQKKKKAGKDRNFGKGIDQQGENRRCASWKVQFGGEKRLSPQFRIKG